jgi:tripartite-type tricarboxylate transporter receptor subunit TctC
MMQQMIRKCALSCLVLALTLIAAQAQDYPNRAIRLIVPYPPGGGMDVTARIVGQKLGAMLSQQIVIENHAGASGTIGAEVVARASPDGYTLLFTPGDFIVVPSLMPRMNFDPDKDLLPIAMVSSNPMVIVANAGAPFNNVKELIEKARASPGGLSYATPGAGTRNHVIGEWIAIAAHIKLMQIPYNGGVEAANGIAGGDVPFGIVSPPSVYPGLVDAGKIKIIALTGERRPTSVPASWPTLAESGLPIDATLWEGLFAPRGTPAAIMSRLDQLVSQIAQDAAVRKRLNDIGFSPDYLSQAAFVERIHTEKAQYDQVIRQTGIAVER